MAALGGAMGIKVDPPVLEEAPITGIASGTVAPVPIPANPYVAAQQPIIAEAFCGATYQGIVVFETVDSVLGAGESSANNATLGDVTWRTLHVNMYDWESAGPTLPYASFFESSNAEFALVIGELSGTCADVPCIALGFDVDLDGGRHHYLIPLVHASEVVHLSALDAMGGGDRSNSGTDPCSDDMYCNDTYRDRIKTALDSFTGCMKDSVPPVSIWNVACFVGCAPFLAGSPIAYALCVLGCNSGLALAYGIDYHTCADQLEAARDNALQSFCACLQYKQQNCPAMAEPDANGRCP